LTVLIWEQHLHNLYMRIHLVRHGETAPDPPNSFYGGSEVPLSAQGKHQAAAAGEYLAHEDLDCIVSSPLSRAVFGAQQVQMRHSKLDILEIDRFREIDRGRWVGHDLASINRNYPNDWSAYLEDPINWRGHGGESLAQVQQRVIAAFTDVLEMGYRNIVIVSHLFPTRIMLNYINKTEELKDLLYLDIPTASVSRIECSDEQGQLVTLTGHIPY